MSEGSALPRAEAGGVEACEPAREPARQSEAVRCAAWLLNSGLDPLLCSELSLRWLAAQIRATRLLDRYGWSWQDIADHLHGRPEQLHLPRWIRSPRAWVRARLARATPTLRPSQLREVLAIERRSPWFAAAAAEHDAALRADITARRDAINACPLCDEHGWLTIDPDPHAPAIRCSHRPETTGW